MKLRRLPSGSSATPTKGFVALSGVPDIAAKPFVAISGAPDTIAKPFVALSGNPDSSAKRFGILSGAHAAPNHAQGVTITECACERKCNGVERTARKSAAADTPTAVIATPWRGWGVNS